MKFVIIASMLFLVYCFFPVWVTDATTSLKEKICLLLIQFPFTYWLGYWGANAVQIKSTYLKIAAAMFFLYGVTSILTFLVFSESILKFATVFKYGDFLFLLFMISIFAWLVFCMVMMIMSNRKKEHL